AVAARGRSPWPARRGLRIPAPGGVAGEGQWEFGTSVTLKSSLGRLDGCALPAVRRAGRAPVPELGLAQAGGRRWARWPAPVRADRQAVPAAPTSAHRLALQ